MRGRADTALPADVLQCAPVEAGMKPMWLSRAVPHRIRRWLRSAFERLSLRVEVLRPRPAYPQNRFSYQRRWMASTIQPGDRVLDVGSGNDPFPRATVLADRFIGRTAHRDGRLVTDGKPLVLADVDALPFRDKAFDFVYCSHLLEHVADPIRACSEIMRVGRRGYIETPTYAEDVLFAWTGHIHRWHVCAAGTSLIFVEYSSRQRDGIRSSAWRDAIFSRHRHPMQQAYYKNLDVFNCMLNWTDGFRVVVHRLDGSMETLGMEGRRHDRQAA